MARYQSRHDEASNVVRVQGRKMFVRDVLNIGRRTYLILDELGAGDRKRYMAFDRDAGPRGALRAILILPDSPAAWQHARVLDNISAHNGALPKVLDFRVVRGKLHIALEWVNGIDLQNLLDDVRGGRRARPSAFEAVRLIRRLAHDLGQVHRKRRIAHGDIKPRNLIVGNEPSRLVLVDFGSAWQFEETTKRDPGDGTSFAYSAPELQKRSQRFVDSRCDQFSCGVVLYEMLTLVAPFEGLGGRAASCGLCSSDLIPASMLHPDRGRIPGEAWKQIDMFISRSLSFEADGRFPTVRSWLDAIDSVQASIRSPTALSPLNGRLTRVVEWFASWFS